MVTFCFSDARERNTNSSKISFRPIKATRILRVQSGALLLFRRLQIPEGGL